MTTDAEKKPTGEESEGQVSETASMAEDGPLGGADAVPEKTTAAGDAERGPGFTDEE